MRSADCGQNDRSSTSVRMNLTHMAIVLALEELPTRRQTAEVLEQRVVEFLKIGD